MVEAFGARRCRSAAQLLLESSSLTPKASKPTRESKLSTRSTYSSRCSDEALGVPQELLLPKTPEVVQQVQEKGDRITLLDVALGILDRFMENEANNESEVQFVRECMVEGHEKTHMPCALSADAEHEEDEEEQQTKDVVRAYLVRSFTEYNGAKAAKNRLKGLHAMGALKGLLKNSQLVPRWPTNELDVPVYTEVEALMNAGFDKWTFNVFDLLQLVGNQYILQFSAWEALRRGNFLTDFQMDTSKVQTFLRRVEHEYHPESKNAYHNSIHAADVTQTVHAVLHDVGFDKFSNELSSLAMVLAAIVHDMGHDGRANAFHINICSDLALTYNDSAVLEKYHISQAFKLMQDPSADPLSALDQEQLKYMRKWMISLVLGTDMSQHFTKVQNLGLHRQRLGRDVQAWVDDSAASDELRVMLLHTCDISHQAKPFSKCAETWSKRVMAEFFAQGDEEKLRGLQVSPLCDRDSVNIPASQAGFIEFIVQPSFEALAAIESKVDSICLEEIAANKQAYEMLAAQRGGTGFEVTPRQFARTPRPELEESKRSQSKRTSRLRLPDTPEVREQVQEGGTATLLIDVALRILSRLPTENDPDEVRFLQECLQAGHSKTHMPCVLFVASQKTGEDDLQAYLLDNCSRLRKGGSSARALLRAAYQKVTSLRHMGLLRRGSSEYMFPRWPFDNLEIDVFEKLEVHLDTTFDNWGFDLFEVSRLAPGQELSFVAWEAFRRDGLFGTFSLEPTKVSTFVARVEALYRPTAYHSNCHAADVTQSVHAVLADLSFSRYFNHLDTLSLLLAAVVHDMGHDGRNNAFHVTVRDDFALTYNDTAVLENFHIAQAFKLLKEDPQADLIDVLGKETRSRVRRQMIDMVLSTDMSMHFTKVGNLTNLSKQLGPDPEVWRADESNMDELRAMILHTCDISHQAKPFPIAEIWANRVLSEFFLQGDEELSKGLRVSPLCDRSTTKLPTAQIGFIDFIVRPTFEALAGIVHRVDEVCLVQIAANIAAWKERREQEEKAAAGEGS